MKSKTVLDVGCGNTKVEGAIGVDQFKSNSVDVVHDLNIYPWPFETESFDRIIFCHSISHFNNISQTLIECHRLLKPGGYVEIVAPHFTSDNYNTDPTHRFPLGYRSMFYFCRNVQFKYKYIPENICFEIESVVISFREVKTSWRETVKANPISSIGIERLVNKYPRFYERFICWLFPASEIYYLMKKSESHKLQIN